MLLGVNIDHIAVLREARKINDPNPLDALHICKIAGADQITIHLREDRRHIHDDDAKNIITLSPLPINLECAIDMIDKAIELDPHRVTLVPEKRQEVTTEGGLDVGGHFEALSGIVEKLHENQIEVSLFIDPTPNAVELSHKLGVDWVEFHTGAYANIYAMYLGGLKNSHHCIEELDLPKFELKKMLNNSLIELESVARIAKGLGLHVAAGHGLNYNNVGHIVAIEEIEELNIGQSIIARSVFVGLKNAIEGMKKLL